MITTSFKVALLMPAVLRGHDLAAISLIPNVLISIFSLYILIVLHYLKHLLEDTGELHKHHHRHDEEFGSEPNKKYSVGEDLGVDNPVKIAA